MDRSWSPHGPEVDLVCARCTFSGCHCWIPWVMGYYIWGGTTARGGRLSYLEIFFVWTVHSKVSIWQIFSGGNKIEPYERIWKTWAPGKCRFFLWLVTHNRCWTADRLARRGLDHPTRCLHCDQDSETINHLLVDCVCTRFLVQPAAKDWYAKSLAPAGRGVFRALVGQNKRGSGWFGKKRLELYHHLGSMDTLEP